MWWGGEPIWVTIQRTGQVAAAMFWPGSETAIDGMRPRYWKPYDESYPGNERVDQVLRWLDLPDADRPTFMTLYFEDTDSAGHRYGPDSDEVRSAITRDDGYLGRLMAGLERRRILDQVNIIVVADHGMAAVSPDGVVVLDDYISAADVEIAGLNPMLGIFPKAGKADALYRALSGAHPRLKVYRREGTPEGWHYRQHPRIPPIVGVADEGWQVLRRSTVTQIQSGKTRGIRGEHGYDPMLLSMRAIFVGSGPAFRSAVTVPPFENVHIYNVLAAILHVTPTKNDGDPALVRSLLK
jgi:predicted AlkP superfamily pyrophosphatase or phosphodiesterase